TPVVWAAGSVQTIRWTHNLGAAATFRVELTRDAGQAWTVLAAAAPASDAAGGAFAWTVTGPSTVSARVRVTWTGRGDVTDVGDALFTINRPPVADAGPDQTVELGQPITLDGRGSSDPDGDPLQFEWKDGTGTVVGTTAVVTLDRAFGVHTFTLTVRDDFGGSDTRAEGETVPPTTALSLTERGLQGGEGRVHPAPPHEDGQTVPNADTPRAYTHT